MKNKRLTFVVSLLAIYLIGAFFVNQKVTNSKKETVTVVCQSPRIGRNL